MNADELLNILEQRDLVSAGMLATLRKQVAAAPRPIAPASVIKVLVDKQELTARQAEQLLRAVAGNAAPAAKPAAAASPKPAVKPASSLSLEEELGLAPSKSSNPAGIPAVKPASARPVSPQQVAVQPVKVAPQPSSLAGSSLSLEEELGLAPSKSTNPSGIPAVKPATVQPAAVQPVKAVPQSSAKPASSVSLEDELGLSPSQSTGPAGIPAVKPAAAKPVAAVAKPAAKPAPAATSGTADLGLDDLLSDDGGLGGGLFDEGLLGAMAEETSAAAPAAAGDPFGAAVATAPVAVAAPVAAAPRPSRPSRTKNVLGIVAGTIGGLALVAGVVAAIVLRGTGDPEFQAAEGDYRAGNWASAATKYDDLLRSYPNQLHASAARVHRGLARIRSHLGERPDWPKALDAADAALPEISIEPEYGELHADLAAILTEMSEVLTRSADEANEPGEVERRLGLARRAHALATNDKYLPPVSRPWQKLQDVDDRLAVLARSRAAQGPGPHAR